MHKWLFTLYVAGIALLAGMTTPAVAQNGPAPKMVKASMANGKIKARIPATFSPLSDDELARKYFTGRRPMVVYSDPYRAVDFGVNVSNSNFNEQDLALMKDFYKASFQALYSDFKILNEETVSINGRTYARFELESTVLPEEGSQSLQPQRALKNYHFVQYTVADGITLVFQFSCPLSLKSQWQATARAMMESLKVKRTLR